MTYGIPARVWPVGLPANLSRSSEWAKPKVPTRSMSAACVRHVTANARVRLIAASVLFSWFIVTARRYGEEVSCIAVFTTHPTCLPSSSRAVTR